MIEKIVRGNSLPEAYHAALKELYWDGEETNCPDWNCKQKELAMTMVVTNATAEPMISKFFIGGPEDLEQYREEMLYGIMDFEVERGNWTYTYHQRYSEQIPLVIEELKRNPFSRRAVLQVRDWQKDYISDDPACLQHIQYFIRNGKLDSTVIFRSNDACKATFMNAFALICLQEMIAKELGVKVGTYTHRANSFHCYDKDYKTLGSFVEKLYLRDDNFAYNYKDGWDEMMFDAMEDIHNKVEELKTHV